MRWRYDGLLPLTPARSLVTSRSREAALPPAPSDRHDPADRPTATELAVAVARGAIRSEFQPKVALASGSFIGVEALARWTHAELGAVPPDSFVPLAERSGLIARLTRSVLRDALAAITTLRRHHPAATVAVNISPVLLDDPALPDMLAGMLAAAGLPPDALVAEITEGRPFADPARAAAVLAALRARGIGCAMDDFGTGYATLPALLRLPFTEIKIDRSFVARIAELPEARRLVDATVRLGQVLGLSVVAEGIENAAIAALLRDAGCDVGQGHHYGKAMPVEAVLARWPGPGGR